MMQRRTLLRAGAAFGGLATGLPVFSQASANVTLWSGFPVGGGLGDQVARPLIDNLRGKYPQPFIYDAKPGASGRIAAEFVKRAAPDGNTLFGCPSTVMTLHPHVFKKLPYDTLADFTPIAGLCTYTAVFTAGPGLPAEIRTVADYLKWAKANPGSANYGVPASGSSLHLAGALLGKQAGVDMQAAQQLAAKVKSGAGFDLNDFLAQIQQMKQMGGLSSLMDKLPAAMAAKAGQVDMDRAEKDIGRKQGIIHSMTPLERRKPELIKATRKRRIAQGAGVHVQEVNRMLKEFEQMQDMMKKMKGGGMMKMMKRMAGMKGMKGMPGMPF